MGMIEEYRKAANSLEAEIRHEQQKNETLIEMRLVPDWRKLDQLHIVYGKMMRILARINDPRSTDNVALVDHSGFDLHDLVYSRYDREGFSRRTIIQPEIIRQTPTHRYMAPGGRYGWKIETAPVHHWRDSTASVDNPREVWTCYCKHIDTLKIQGR